ncbi:hypothetical protein [Yoonia sp. BS5-3]|uniref:Phage baseplate protein n=1 Tax=Yoonia phaeophyticola TaxID=3137369 RepID=A0ABZ2V6W9_9RHOB
MATGPIGSVILGLYEQGMTASPAQRAALLAQAGGEKANATLGDADRAAWRILTRYFGPAQDAVLTCPSCGAEVEFTLPANFSPPEAETEADLTIQYKGAAITLRLPRLSDLQNGPFDPRKLAPDAHWTDPDFRKAAEAALMAADPALKCDLALSCAACDTDQTQVLDVTGFVWARIEQAARALVRDVAKLARFYGWSEAEITAMTPVRRAIYLREMDE